MNPICSILITVFSIPYDFFSGLGLSPIANIFSALLNLIGGALGCVS